MKDYSKEVQSPQYDQLDYGDSSPYINFDNPLDIAAYSIAELADHDLIEAEEELRILTNIKDYRNARNLIRNANNKIRAYNKYHPLLKDISIIPIPNPTEITKEEWKLIAEKNIEITELEITQELVEILFDHKDFIEFNYFLRHNIRLVVGTVLKMTEKVPVPRKYLITEGILGLIKAVETFETQRELKFSTHAVWQIRGYISHYIEKVYLIHKEEIQVSRIKYDGHVDMNSEEGLSIDDRILLSDPEKLVIDFCESNNLSNIEGIIYVLKHVVFNKHRILASNTQVVEILKHQYPDIYEESGIGNYSRPRNIVGNIFKEVSKKVEANRFKGKVKSRQS